MNSLVPLRVGLTCVGTACPPAITRVPLLAVIVPDVHDIGVVHRYVEHHRDGCKLGNEGGADCPHHKAPLGEDRSPQKIEEHRKDYRRNDGQRSDSISSLQTVLLLFNGCDLLRMRMSVTGPSQGLKT